MRHHHYHHHHNNTARAVASTHHVRSGHRASHYGSDYIYLEQCNCYVKGYRETNVVVQSNYKTISEANTLEAYVFFGMGGVMLLGFIMAFILLSRTKE